VPAAYAKSLARFKGASLSSYVIPTFDLNTSIYVNSPCELRLHARNRKYRSRIIMSRLIAVGLKILLGIALICAAEVGSAQAASTSIVALGSSNTEGKGVGSSSAWPAQLEQLLRARGYDAQVTNAGISGNDTGLMLARIGSAVPEGTQIVILEKAATNDRLRGVDTGGNIAQMTSWLQARKIKVIVIDGMHGWANGQLQADGVHITEAGHAAVAAKLLPRVIAAIGNRK
jgi:acyl-CoA thioesterase I